MAEEYTREERQAYNKWEARQISNNPQSKIPDIAAWKKSVSKKKKKKSGPCFIGSSR